MANIATIGSTGDYATLSDWLLLRVPATLDDDYIAEMLPEQHVDTVSITAITTLTYKLVIRPHSTTPYHYGLASNVSGVFSATLEPLTDTSPLITVASCNLEVYGLEFVTYQEYPSPIISTTTSGACTLSFYRNIFRSIAQGTPSSSNVGIYVNDTDVICNFYRNLFYGFGGQGLLLSNFGEGTRVNQNTAYYCGVAGGSSNFNFNNTAGVADVAMRNNVSIYPAAGSADYVRTGTITWQINYRTTAGGGGGAGTLTLSRPATEFEWAKSTYDEGQVRLLLQQGAQLIGVGATTYGTLYFPAIRLNDQYPTGSPQPDVGADEYEPDRGDRPWGWRPWMDTRRIGIRGNRPGYFDESPGWL